MRAVGVHLDEQLVARAEPPGEPREVGRPEPVLLRAVQDVDVLVGGRTAIGEIARAVRGVVVDDEDVGGRGVLAHPVQGHGK